LKAHARFFDLQKVAGSISQALKPQYSFTPLPALTIMQQVDHPRVVIVVIINRKSKIEITHVIDQIDFISP
jgi:hypothetical protein